MRRITLALSLAAIAIIVIPLAPHGPTALRAEGTGAIQTVQHLTLEPKIISPTRGYDFGPYLKRVVDKINAHWSFDRQVEGQVVITFRIEKDGSVPQVKVIAVSGADSLDRAAFDSIKSAGPFLSLSTYFEGDHLDLQMTYIYKMR